MSMPTEFHEQCRLSLENGYLQAMYIQGQEAAMSSAARYAQTPNSTDAEVSALSLHLMAQILSWDFHSSATFIQRQLNGTVGGTSGGEGGALKLVKPGAKWRHVLLEQTSLGWLVEFYARYRGMHIGSDTGQWVDSPLAVNSRQVTVQHSLLSGDIFPSNDHDTLRLTFLQTLLSGVFTWLQPLDRVTALADGGHEGEVIDFCRVLGGLACSTSATALESIDSALGQLAMFTCHVIRAGGVADSAADSWTGEALDMLLEAWSHLLEPPVMFQGSKAATTAQPTLSQGAVAAASEVFAAYVAGGLSAAAGSALEEDDANERLRAAEAARDLRLASAASLARSAALHTLATLGGAFAERRRRLEALAGEGEEKVIETLEEMHWLVLMCGHVVADAAEGETPLVPYQVLEACATTAPDSDPLVVLSRSILDFACLSLNPEVLHRLLSPRLMESLIWFLARWASTYLMPESFGHLDRGSHPGVLNGAGGVSLSMAFGEEGGGPAIAEALLRISQAALTAWPGEGDLQEQVCSRLLPALVSRPSVCRRAIHTEPWQQLAHAFATFNPPLAQLAAPLQRELSEALCRVVVGLEGEEAASRYVKELIGPVGHQLAALAGRGDLAAVAQRPQVLLQVCCLLERFRGAVRATLPRSQKTIFQIALSATDPLLTLLQAYHNQPSVVYLILKYVVEWVENHVAYLSSEETSALLGFCVRLLQLYSANNMGKVSLDKSNLAEESRKEKYKDLRAMLQLLTNLTSKDLVDFGNSSTSVTNGYEADSPDVAQVVYLGLHIVIPLISVDLLKYPKLCRQYFTLLAHMLEVYPEKVSLLPANAFSQIAASLKFGLRHQEPEVATLALEAMGAMASFHVSSTTKGGCGLGQNALGQGGSTHGVLEDFLKQILQLLLFEDYSSDLVEPAANALLPLILSHPAVYQGLGHELLAQQQDAAMQGRVAAALNSLLASNNFTSSLDRPNRRRFRQNLQLFLADVRGFLRTK